MSSRATRASLRGNNNTGSWIAGNATANNPNITPIGRDQATSAQAKPEPEAFPPPVVEDIPSMEVENEEPSAEAVGTPSRKRQAGDNGGEEKRVKRKRTVQEKHQFVKKNVKPRNAQICLNDLSMQRGFTVQYINEQQSGIDNGGPFNVTVELNKPGEEKQRFSGYGITKPLAKLAAAEAALVSFVGPPAKQEGGSAPEESSETSSQDPEKSEAKNNDPTPWGTLASFALYKLFSDWREGRVGVVPTSFPQAMRSVAMMGAAAVPAAMQQQQQQQQQQEQQQPQAQQVKNPCKELPASAAAMNPTMLLHQMHPGVKFSSEASQRDKKPYYQLSAEINGRTFSGEGFAVKKAKALLAKTAMFELHGVVSTYEIPEK